MSSNNSLTDSPPSTAGETPTMRDNEPSPSATEPALPPPATIGLEISPGGDEAPATPAQICADQDGIVADIKESMEHIGRDEDAPVPPVQTAAAHEEMESTIKQFVQHTQSEDVPMTPSQIAAGFEDMDQAIKEPTKDANSSGSGMDPPLPPSQMAALVEEMEGDEGHGSKRRAAPTAEEEDNSQTPSLSALPPIAEEETLRQAQDPPTPAVTRAPSSPQTNQGRSPSNPRRQQQIPIRPPPPSMMPSPDEDPSTPSVQVPTLPRDSSASMLEATPVPEIPVYNAIQVAEQTWMKKYKKYILVGLGIFFGGAAVAAGVAVGSNNGSSDRPLESSSSSGVPSLHPTLPPSTALPPDSSSPSQFPSLGPTLQPSQSAKPSRSPSRSLRPSLDPSTSASPTPFCFGGEINILTDSYPEDTSWTISRIDNVEGVANLKVVLEGSPEEEGHLTSVEACLARGDYEFAIFDSWGNGISSPGYYNVTFEGQVIARGGKFESEERVPFSLPIWNRQGLGFNGDASFDRFGYAVAFSADASTMAIGAPGGPGYVKVYHREGEGSSWKQRGDTLRGEANGDYFGDSLALSEDGTILSIGAPYHDSVGPYSGQVKVYKWEETALNYAQIGNALYGAASGDQFGWSLDISSGKILAVGARFSNANGNGSGQVTVYAWDDASFNFKQRGEAIDGDAAGDWFGWSVSLSGNGQKLAMGAPYNDSNGRDSGQVRVFEWVVATENYEQLGDSLPGDAAGDLFGRSVSFSCDGTSLAVGAPRNDENGQESGQVKVFAWDEAAANFEQIGQSLYGEAARDYFGLSVALSSEGKTLAVGANQCCDKPGYVEVYGWDEAALEYKRHGQSLDGEASRDEFGGALALAGNGRDLVVGAPGNDRNGTASGRVEVFHIEL